MEFGKKIIFDHVQNIRQSTEGGPIVFIYSFICIFMSFSSKK
jgi:hypothetical protein